MIFCHYLQRFHQDGQVDQENWQKICDSRKVFLLHLVCIKLSCLHEAYHPIQFSFAKSMAGQWLAQCLPSPPEPEDPPVLVVASSCVILR